MPYNSNFIDTSFNPNTISLEDEQVTDPSRTIILDEQAPVVSLDKPVALNQARKYHDGLGRFSPGVDRLSEALQSGTEDRLRRDTLMQKQREDHAKRLELAGAWMANAGEAATPEMYERILRLTDAETNSIQEDPKAFWEKMFAEHVVNVSHSQEPFEAAEENDLVANSVLRIQKDITTKQTAVQKWIADEEAVQQGRPELQKWASWGETFIPFYAYAAVGYSLPEDLEVDNILPGELKEQTYQALWQLPYEQMMPKARQVFEEIKGYNETVAMSWLHGLAGYSASDRYLDNFSGFADFASVVPVASAARIAKGVAGLVKGTTKVQDLVDTTKQALKITGNRTYKPEALRLVAGDAEGTALEMATKKILEKANRTKVSGELAGNPVPPFEELIGQTPAFFNPVAALGQDSLTLTAEHTQRLIASAEQSSVNLLNAAVDAVSVDRLLSKDQLNAAIKAAKANFNDQYPNEVNRLIDSVPVTAADTLFNVELLAHRIGTKNAMPFQTYAAAARARSQIGFKENATIRKMGDNNFVIEITKPIDETDPFVRNVEIPTSQKTPVNLQNTWLGWLRTPQDTLPPQINRAMANVTFGSSSFRRYVAAAAKPFTSLSGKKGKDFNSFLKKQSLERQPNGQVGRFSNSQGEFEKDWYSFHNRMPTAQESGAYFAYRHVNDFGLVMHNIGLLRDKLRQGFENFSFNWKDPAFIPEARATAPVSELKNIEGKYVRGGVEGIAWNEKAGIVVLDEAVPEKGTFSYHNTQYTNAQKLKESLGDENYSLIHLTPEGYRRMRDAPGFRGMLPKGHFTYVLTKNYKTSPLQWNQVPYRPGGVIDYPQGYFVGQPGLTTLRAGERTVGHHYEGDINLFNFATSTEAKTALTALEKARVMLKDALDTEDFVGMNEINGVYSPPRYTLRTTSGKDEIPPGAAKENALHDFLQENLPFSVPEFMKLFKRESNPDGLFDIDIPFMDRQLNQTLREAHKLDDSYPGLIDVRDGPLNLYSTVNLKHALEREGPVHTYKRTGDAQLPAYKLEKADILDPTLAMDRMMNQLMRGRFLEDAKFKFSENFIAEFSKVMKTPIDEMRVNPMKYLLDPVWAEGADKGVLAAAKNYRRTILNFIGMKNQFQQTVDYTKQKLADTIFNVGGEKAFKLVQPWLLGRETNPVTFFRQVAFHTYMGLFNPVQMFLQAQTVVHMAGVEGLKRAYQGLSAATFMRPLLLNNSPSMVRAAGKRAAAMGFGTVDEFVESYTALQRSGFGVVDMEYGVRDALFDSRTFRSSTGEFLDKGLFFFKKGEELSRVTAWNTAYRRWKDMNPGRKFDDVAIEEVRDRADLLNVNMATNSLAAWNKGFMGLPLQFTNYTARLSEQFLGKRLTVSEKARALATYSAIYGLPAAAGVPFGVMPYYEDIRQALLERGIDYDDNLVTKTLVDGLASVSVEYVTGTKFNVGSRYAPSGLPLIKDIIKGDKSFLEMFGGAAGTSMGSMFEAALPITSSLFYTATGGNDHIPVLWADIEKFVRSTSTGNALYKLHYGVGLGEFVTKNGIKVDNVTGTEAVISSIFGVMPQRTEDIFIKLESNKEFAEMQQHARKEYTRYMDKAMDALRKGDVESYEDLWKQAHLWVQAGRFKFDQMGDLFTGAVKGKDMLMEIEKKFSEQDPARLPNHIRTLKERQRVLEENE